MHTGTPRRATYGGRVCLWPASPLGHDATQSPWRRHGQPDWRARPTTQGGQGAAQGRAGRPEAVRCRPPPAACRLPPPAAARRPPATVKACGPASSTCRRDGTAWAGNSWLPRAVGTAQRLGPGSVEMRPEIRAVGVASPAGRQCMHVTCAHEGGVRHQC